MQTLQNITKHNADPTKHNADPTKQLGLTFSKKDQGLLCTANMDIFI